MKKPQRWSRVQWSRASKYVTAQIAIMRKHGSAPKLTRAERAAVVRNVLRSFPVGQFEGD